MANRRYAPNADGMLLPLAGLLNGLGYVFIARLDDDLAALQATWTMVGIGVYIATLVVVRETRMLERYRYMFSGCSCSRSYPGSATPSSVRASG